MGKLTQLVEETLTEAKQFGKDDTKTLKKDWSKALTAKDKADPDLTKMNKNIKTPEFIKAGWLDHLYTAMQNTGNQKRIDLEIFFNDDHDKKHKDEAVKYLSPETIETLKGSVERGTIKGYTFK